MSDKLHLASPNTHHERICASLRERGDDHAAEAIEELHKALQAVRTPHRITEASMQISDEAVEAAAREFYSVFRWDSITGEAQARWKCQARAALEAAMPHLLASQGCGTGHSADAGSLPALAPEWRRYDGKGRPVPNGTPIEIMQKNGEVRKGTHWSEATWEVGGRFSSDDVQFWRPWDGGEAVHSPDEREGSRDEPKAGEYEGCGKCVYCADLGAPELCRGYDLAHPQKGGEGC